MTNRWLPSTTTRPDPLYTPEWAQPGVASTGGDEETTLPEGMDHPGRPDCPERFAPR